MLLSRNFPPTALSPFISRSGAFSSDLPVFKLTDFWPSGGAFLCFGSGERPTEPQSDARRPSGWSLLFGPRTNEFAHLTLSLPNEGLRRNEYDGNMTEGEPHVRCGLLVAGTSG